MEEIIIYYILIALISYFGLFTTIFFIYTLIEYRKKIKDPYVDLKDPKIPAVTIIIPAYNEEKCISKTIRSVQNLNYPKRKIEIIVVDDGSTDGTLKEARKIAQKDPRIKVYTKKNGGKGSALNFGIKKAHNEFIISLDADSFVSRNALRKMIGYFQDSRVMAVTPAMTIHKPRGFLQNLQFAEYTLGIFLRKTFGLLNCIHVTPGPFSIYRKSFFKKYGGYDENNLTEDIEIALRIQKNGYKIENSMSASVYTVAPNKFSKLLKQRMRWYYGFTINVLKNKDLFKPKFGYMAVLLLPAAFISVLISILLAVYFIYKNITYIIAKIVQLNVTGTGLLSVELKKINWKNVWDLIYNEITNPLVALVIIAIIFSIATLIYTKKKSNDNRPLFLPIIYFMLTYWFFYAFWWLSPFIYKAFGGKIGWGKRKH